MANWLSLPNQEKISPFTKRMFKRQRMFKNHSKVLGRKTENGTDKVQEDQEKFNENVPTEENQVNHSNCKLIYYQIFNLIHF